MDRYKLIFTALILICFNAFAAQGDLQKTSEFQKSGQFDQAIDVYKSCLLQPIDDGISDQQIKMCTDALVQLMNAYQSKGAPNECISVLRDIFDLSPVLQTHCLRDYYSVLGYALSRTEAMNEAEEVTLMALTLPLKSATSERYFRDYAYAAAVFYNNPNYQKQVVHWCKEALYHANQSANSSGKQWVTAMLGSLYKKSGDLNMALELYQQSKDEAASGGDDLGVLNSLCSIVDLFLYWDIPEYADMYATEAVIVEKKMLKVNPMVSAQAYINKGRTLHQLGIIDSVSFYNEQARQICQSLPYNSGMVDVNLLDGIILTEKGGDSVYLGIQELQRVVQNGTHANKVKAYHQLAQTYLRQGDAGNAEAMLDSLYELLSQSGAHNHLLHLDYQPILTHYLINDNQERLEQYLGLLVQEHEVFKENRVNENLVKAIVRFQSENKVSEKEILQLTQANLRLWFLVSFALSVIIVFIIIGLLLRQKRRYKRQMEEANMKLDTMVRAMEQTNTENEALAQEVRDLLRNREKRHELETLTPQLLREGGETKFRQCFELLYPQVLHRLREKVPTVSRREELLSMLIVLKQDNKEIADLLSVAPKSVLMLRHRFRQKIGLTSDYSLENFIETLLRSDEFVC